MDFIMNILGTFYSGYWLFGSIPTSIFIFVMLCIKLDRALVRKKLKKWRIDDIAKIDSYSSYYEYAKKHSPSGKPHALLKKWSIRKSLIEFGNGEQYYVKTSILENLDSAERKRNNDLDEFMEENNGIKSPKERRDDAIDNVIGKDV